MLNRPKAYRELRKLILELNPAWQYQQASKSDYLEELSNILKKYLSAPNPVPEEEEKSSVQEAKATPPTTDKVEALRILLRNIVDNEKSLKLDKKLCDQAFEIEFVLAKLFPLNDKVSVDDNGNPVTEETWLDPISMDNFTRKTPDIIIFTRSYALLKNNAEVHYQNNLLSLDRNGKPRDLSNTVLSTREINSLRKQGIDLSQNWGRRLGGNIGAFLSLMILTSLIFFVPLPVLQSPAVFYVGMLTALLREPQMDIMLAFMVGVNAVVCLGTLVNIAFSLSLPLLIAANIVPVTAAAAASFFFSTLFLPAGIPLMTLAMAGILAWKHNLNITTTIRFSMLSFHLSLIGLCAGIGGGIAHRFVNAYRLERVESNEPPDPEDDDEEVENNVVIEIKPELKSQAQIMRALGADGQEPAEAKNDAPSPYPLPSISRPTDLEEETNNAYLFTSQDRRSP